MARPKERAFDPSRDVMLDARNLRGLAHPLRLKLLGLLREEGPATATSLGARLGESSGATSYHLRQLAEYGFIRDSGVPSTGRERWWEAAHQYTYFEPGEGGDETTRLLGAEYLRAVARAYGARTEAWVDSLETLPPGWRDVGSISDYRLRLTPEGASALVDELSDLAERYRDKVSAEAGANAATVSLQFQVLPVVGDEAPTSEDDHA
jgi:DNA-binding transcriptional ArsR family regulator